MFPDIGHPDIGRSLYLNNSECLNTGHSKLDIFVSSFQMAIKHPVFKWLLSIPFLVRFLNGLLA
jgi:hypothetical protein